MKVNRVLHKFSPLVRYIIVLTFIVFALSGCDHCENQCPRCISADDFGTPKSNTSAFFEKDSDFLKSDLARLGLESPSDRKQILRWQDSGYVTSGDPINLVVRGRWAFIPDSTSLHVPKRDMESVFHCGELDTDALKKASAVLQRIVPTEVCTFNEVTSSDPFSGCSIKGEKIDAKFSLKGCILEKGYGLYLLFRRKTDNDPNTSFDTISHPGSPVIHVGYTGESISIKEIPMSDCTKLKIEPGWKVYYKILDKVYQNNIGGYSLEFRTGLVDPKLYSKFFESVRSTIQKLLTEQNRAIYNAITSNNDYVGLVKALIVLMIVLMGLKFLLGMSEHPASELLVKVLQMAIILQLISPSSWDFFYNNLFSLFIDGLNEVIAVVNSHTGGSYDPEQPFAFLDRTVNILFGVLVSTKVKAILLAYPLGVFWWLILFFVLVIYVILVAYAFVVYMTALVGLSVLIILMPILFLGMLFGQLKHTFDNWFTQALSFCFQAIMIFTLVSLFSAMIKDQFYRNLGYTVCCNSVFSIFNSTVYAWTPGQNFMPFSSALWSSKRVSFSDKANIIDVPPDYENRGCRFVDYPFYDPKIPIFSCTLDGSPSGEGYDWERIKQLREADSGLLDMGEVFVLLLLAVIMYHMRDLVQSVGAALVGASPFQAIIGSAYAAADGIGGLYRAGKFMVTTTLTGLTEKVPQIKALNRFVDNVSSPYDYVSGKIAEKLNEVQAPRALIDVLGAAGKVAGDVVRSTTYLTGMNSELGDLYFEKRVFKNIHYVQSIMGYHLGAVFGSRDLQDSTGISILSASTQHICDRYITGRKEDDLFSGVKKLYACEREKLHDYYLGIKKETLNDSLIFKEKGKGSKEDGDPFGMLSKSDGDGKPDHDLLGYSTKDSVFRDPESGHSLDEDAITLESVELARSEIEEQLASRDTSVEDLSGLEDPTSKEEGVVREYPVGGGDHENLFFASGSETDGSSTTLFRGFVKDPKKTSEEEEDDSSRMSGSDTGGLFHENIVRSDNVMDSLAPDAFSGTESREDLSNSQGFFQTGGSDNVTDVPTPEPDRGSADDSEGLFEKTRSIEVGDFSATEPEKSSADDSEGLFEKTRSIEVGDFSATEPEKSSADDSEGLFEKTRSIEVGDFSATEPEKSSADDSEGLFEKTRSIEVGDFSATEPEKSSATSSVGGKNIFDAMFDGSAKQVGDLSRRGEDSRSRDAKNKNKKVRKKKKEELDEDE